MKRFSFTLEQTNSLGRAGRFQTEHGKVQTPIFMPVGTQATVKALDTQDIQALDAQIILANTYHLYLRPGMVILQSQGGVHKFMGWSGPMLTDSGGFQVFSLGKQLQRKQLGSNEVRHGGPPMPFSKITEEGVEFTSHLDGSRHFFSPEEAIEIQRQIGADIMMAFDECTPDLADARYAREALDRTHRWARQCVRYWEEQGKQSVYGHYQALFGIIQGAQHPELRRESAQVITELGFDGIAIGGETVGYNMEKTVEIMDWIGDIVPEEKPRYAMGLGRDPQNLLDAVNAGFDMFDCVAPTRLARNGALYAGYLDIDQGGLKFISESAKGRMQIGNQRFTRDERVIQDGCDCYTCSHGYSRAYLNHLFKADELTYYRLASLHNVRFMVRLSQEIRQAILEQ